MKDLVTIVIPSYNEENYIYTTIWKISKQIGVDGVRVIVADGGSTDKTIEFTSKASQDFGNLNIELIDGGKVAYGRNNGASNTTTPYILFMDADSVLMENDILKKSLEEIQNFDIVTCKQKSTQPKLLSNLTWNLFNVIRKLMPETFCTGCYFFISKEKFNELGGFDETLNNSEDFWLSRKVKKSKFKILNRYVGQDNRRFDKMGYFKFIKILILNYWHKNNLEYFKKDVGYWEPYE